MDNRAQGWTTERAVIEAHIGRSPKDEDVDKINRK